MPSPPRVKLSVLRDIGWREWDPIGLRTPKGGWEGSSAADEYDRYLLHVATRLRNGEAEGPLVDYLVEIETDYMGSNPDVSTRPRAVATVASISDYVRRLV